VSLMKCWASRHRFENHPTLRVSPTGIDGRRVHTVQQIAEEFGVTRPTIYRHLQPRTV
jgi:Helix-turn-helix domain of resolvase